MTTQTTPPVAPPRPPTPGHGLRTSLQLLGVGLSLALVAWGALTLAGLLARVTDRSSATYAGVRSVTLELGFESVQVVGSTEAAEVSMQRRWTWSMAEPTIVSRREGDRLVLTSSCPFSPGLGCSGTVRLRVPAGTRVQGRTSDGRLSLRDLTGPVDVSTRDGAVDATGLRGRVAIDSRDGSVAATGLRSSDVTVHTSDGSVRLAFAVPPSVVKADVRDGSLAVTVPADGTAYDVVAETSDGSREVSVPTDPSSQRRLELRTRDGSLRLDDGS